MILSLAVLTRKCLTLTQHAVMLLPRGHAAKNIDGLGRDAMDVTRGARA